MKEFRYEKGHLAGRTLTVKELIEKLHEYDDDLPVMATWESVNAYIDPDNFELKTVSKGHDEDECVCLVIDVEEH